jgi:hypothetical protein
MRGASLLLVALALALAGVTRAQERPQWTLTTNGDVTIAHTTLGSRAAFVVRCAADQLSVLLAGVPAPTDRMSVTTIVDGSVDLTGGWWLVDDGSTLMSRRPARYARTLAAGHAVSLMARSGEGQPWIVEASLPADRTPVDAVLEACDLPLSDPRDTLGAGGPDAATTSPVSLHWERQPTPRFPDRAISKGLTEGTVVVTCMTGPAGSLRECRAESELPVGGNFGQEAVRAANNARLGRETTVGRLVEFDITFLIR